MAKRRVNNKKKPSRAVVLAGRTPSRAFVPVSPPQQRVVRPRKTKRLASSPLRLTPAGVAFLKSAFAAPDFSIEPAMGIPDTFSGLTLAQNDCFTGTVSVPPNTTSLFLVAPVPGFAYFRLDGPPGNHDPSTWPDKKLIGVRYPTFESNYGSTQGSATEFTSTQNFTKFRFLGLTAGMYPMMNYMNFNGAISVWRVDVNKCTHLGSSLRSYTAGPPAATTLNTESMLFRLAGLRGIFASSPPRDNYTESIIKGAFTYAFDISENFEWSDFSPASRYCEYYPGTNWDPSPVPPSTDSGCPRLAATDSAGFPNDFLPGFGNTNCLVFRVMNATVTSLDPPTLGANASFVFKTWQSVELQPQTNSNIYQFSRTSPPYDPMALLAYHKLKTTFPVAVPCAQNAGFWNMVMNGLRQLFGQGTKLPGSFGQISTGLLGVTNLIGSLIPS